MRKVFFLLALFFLGNCGMPMQISPEKAERIKMCKKLCDKEHYNVKFIRADGTIEYYKISIVSIQEKTACECKF